MDLGVLGVIHDLDGVRLGHLVIVRPDRLHLNHLDLLRRIAVVAEDDRAIGRHALLRDDDALAAADDEVAAIILGALAESNRGQMLLVMQEAVFGAYHHGNLAEVDIGEETLLHLACAAIRVVDEGSANTDIYKEG